MMNPDPNKLISQIPSPFLEDLLEISNTIRKHEGEAYLVGGSVRDLILNKVPHEYDLAVSISPEKMQKIFKRTVPTGIKHGTITVLFQDRSYELTTFRKDEDYLDGRRPETVQFGVSLSEDLKRRDFTMNALALDLLEKTLVDEHSGIEDIQNSLIRTIGNPVSRFTEDGLRPVRAIRFVSTLGFSIHPETAEAIETCRPITAKVSPERIHDEFLKVLKSKNPIGGLDLFKKYKILELFSKTKLYSGEWEKRVNGFSELLQSSERIKITYFLASCFSEQTWVSDSTVFFKELRFSNQRTKDSQFLIKTLYSIIQHREELKTSAGLRTHLLHPIAQYVGKKDLWDWCLELSDLWSAFLNEEASWRTNAEEEWKKNPPLLLSDLAVDGNLIREKFPELPAPKLGEVLRSSLLAVLQDPNQNSEQYLLDLIRKSL
ncbi:CCA tRNA nucleotidyltransferase [Leptospira koniambonensis]|uniref:CCA tRNA nucleotidyltransferase n=1 Tax=Leptospira koniambonensis TaxID=2484950 RepID=A0A4R9J4T9_9LEPT|nr:CCA tRNA nucleotidyltransferase [Leptospira koniambonensis]TGL29729.1 CCA tRNA nucleotidyltransferase [Leptospira koniambonensis]